jgi:hypothetical protein
VFDFMSPEQEQYKLAETLAAEALLLGRVTYEGFSAAWPERGGEFADKMNAMPKYVASATLQDPAWHNTTVLDGDVREAVAQLKRGDGGPILVAGSCTLVHALLTARRRAAAHGLPGRAWKRSALVSADPRQDRARARRVARLQLGRDGADISRFLTCSPG